MEVEIYDRLSRTASNRSVCCTVPAMFGYTLHILHEFLAIFWLRQVMLHVWLFTKVKLKWHTFEPGLHNRYNHWSSGRKTEEFVSRRGQEIYGLQNVQTGSESRQASWLLCVRGSFLVVEAVGKWRWPLTATWCARLENAGLYIQCPMAWCVIEHYLLLRMCRLDGSE